MKTTITNEIKSRIDFFNNLIERELSKLDFSDGKMIELKYTINYISSDDRKGFLILRILDKQMLPDITDIRFDGTELDYTALTILGSLNNFSVRWS